MLRMKKNWPDQDFLQSQTTGRSMVDSSFRGWGVPAVFTVSKGAAVFSQPSTSALRANMTVSRSASAPPETSAATAAEDTSCRRTGGAAQVHTCTDMHTCRCKAVWVVVGVLSFSCCSSPPQWLSTAHSGTTAAITTVWMCSTAFTAPVRRDTGCRTTGRPARVRLSPFKGHRVTGAYPSCCWVHRGHVSSLSQGHTITLSTESSIKPVRHFYLFIQGENPLRSRSLL